MGASNKKSENQKYTFFSQYRNHILFVAFISLVTLIIFSSVSNFDFINWDDDRYVTANDDIRELSIENVKTIFTSFYVSNYQPLTMLTYSLDYQVGGLDPKVFHITNLLIHLINTILVYILIFNLFTLIVTKRIFVKIMNIRLLSGIVALLFAIHPLQIESIAWVAERKNVMFALFFFMSLISYVFYLRLDKTKYIVLSLLFFLCSLLSKGVAVSLSLTLICIDYFAGRKLLSKKVIIEKIPFFALSVLFGIIAIYAQNESGALESGGYSFFRALLYASYAFIGYLIKIVLPINLCAAYLYSDSITWAFWLCLILSLIVVYGIIQLIRKGKKELVFGVLFYVVNIALLLQLIPVGSMIMADRYVYVAGLGAFLLVGLGYVYLSQKRPFLSNAGLIVFIVFLVITSVNRLKVWENSLTLWNDVIEKAPGFENAWNNRGRIHEDNGDYSKAVADYAHFVTTFKTSANLQRAYNNLGNAKSKLNDSKGALSAFEQALKIDSTYFEAYVNQGILYRKQNKYKQALQNFNKALELSDHFIIYYNRGITKYDLGDLMGAISDLEIVKSRKPELVNEILANSYFQTRQYSKAVEVYLELLKGNPGLPVYQYLAYAYYSLGNYKNAIWAYDGAIRLHPDNLTIYADRGLAKMNVKDYSGAIQDFNKVLQGNKNNAQVFYNRGISYINSGNMQQGCSDLHQALELGYARAMENINRYCKN